MMTMRDFRRFIAALKKLNKPSRRTRVFSYRRWQ